MTSKRTLKRWFQDPIKNADKIIEDRLDWGASRCEYLSEHTNRDDAYALYKEYEEWVNTEDNETFNVLLLDQIATY
jgi:hypothetical protein